MIENCIGFNETGKCISCIQNYYISEASDGKAYCCKDGQYVKLNRENKPICLSLNLIT